MAVSSRSNVAGLQSHPAPISKGDVVVVEGYYASGDGGGGEMVFEGTPPPAGAQIAGAVAAVSAVNGAINAAPIVISTGQPHGFVTGQSVLISGVNGNAAANGTWIVTVANSTQFSLDGSFGSGAYLNGGFASIVIVTAGAPHGLEADGQVMIARVAWTSGAGINGLWEHVGVLDATRFSIGASTTGTWSTGGIFGDGGVSFPSTAVNGRWLRSVTHPLNVRWWGAKGDGSTDDHPAFAATLAYVDAQLGIQNFPSAVAVFVPQGQYRLAKTLFLNRPIDLFGEGRSASLLLFKTALPAGAPIDGIVLQRHSNMPTTPPFYDASAARVRRLGIFGDGNSYVLSQAPYPLFQEFDPLTSGPVSTGHGYLPGNGVVVLTHNGTVEDCAIGGFRFDGVHVEAIASSDGTHDSDNANEWSVRDCQLVDSGRHGLFVSGGENTNAGYAQGLDVLGNSGCGIYDRSFLGNAYHG
jgi:hypothetical protein